MSARPLRRLIAVSSCLVSLLLIPQAASPVGTAGRLIRGEAG